MVSMLATLLWQQLLRHALAELHGSQGIQGRKQFCTSPQPTCESVLPLKLSWQPVLVSLQRCPF